MTLKDKAAEAGKAAAELLPEKAEELRALFKAGSYAECYDMAQEIVAERYIT